MTELERFIDSFPRDIKNIIHSYFDPDEDLKLLVSFYDETLDFDRGKVVHEPPVWDKFAIHQHNHTAHSVYGEFNVKSYTNPFRDFY